MSEAMARCTSKPGIVDKLKRIASSLPSAGPEDISLREYRLENGLDLWTGQPLYNLNAENWLQIKSNKAERPPVTEVQLAVEIMKRERELNGPEGFDALCDEIELYYNESGKDGYEEMRKLARASRK